MSVGEPGRDVVRCKGGGTAGRRVPESPPPPRHLHKGIAAVERHAYGGRKDRPILITAATDERELTVRVRDWGNGVDPTTIPHEPYNPLTPGGVGLICLSELLDRMVYEPQPDGMLATLVKRRV